MKYLSLLILVSLNGFGAHLPRPQLDEKVLVKNIEQFVNLMPIIGDREPRRPVTTLEVKVQSNGCTEAEHFEVEVIRLTQQEQLLRIVRLSPDFCRGVQHTVAVTLTTRDAALMNELSTRILNPLLAEIQVAH